MQEYQQTDIEENEIDLRELFSTIWKNKWKLFFTSLLITSLTIINVITTPNSYSSKTILIMKEQSKPSIGGGAAALAAMAGVNLGGGGGGLDISSMFKNLIEDFSFNTYVIKKYHLMDRLSTESMNKNMVYALNGKRMAMDIKNFFKSKDNKKNPQNKNDVIFGTFKRLQSIISASTDKASGTMTLSATLEDRFLAKELVNIYLKEMSDYIKVLDMKEIAEQEAYYNNELAQASSIELKQNLADLLSALMKKKVLSQVGEYYMVKQLTKADIAYVKDKSKPKRGLIIIVAFITSIILGIFMIFFREFLNKKDVDEIEVKKEIIKDSSRESDISF